LGNVDNGDCSRFGRCSELGTDWSVEFDVVAVSGEILDRPDSLIGRLRVGSLNGFKRNDDFLSQSLASFQHSGI